VASGGTQSISTSYNASISADGRYVAFESHARNLIAGDTNVGVDVFVHDRTIGETTRVSVASDGSQATAGSSQPSISADGRYVAFESIAPNLVAGDTSPRDIFVHDRTSGTTTLVSVASDGSQGNFGSNWDPSVSADGRYITFRALDPNLAAGDTNIADDVFIHDRTTGTTARVSVADDGVQGNSNSWSPAVSGNGKHVVFIGDSDNLVLGFSSGIEQVYAVTLP
jgi:Tol biopolymer transport system component